MTEQTFSFEVSFWSSNAWWPTSATAASGALSLATAVSPWASSTSSPVPSTSRVIVWRSSNVWRTGVQGYSCSFVHQTLGMDMEGYPLRINRWIWSGPPGPHGIWVASRWRWRKWVREARKKNSCAGGRAFSELANLCPCSARVPMFEHPSSLPELRWPNIWFNRPHK